MGWQRRRLSIGTRIRGRSFNFNHWLVVTDRHLVTMRLATCTAVLSLIALGPNACSHASRPSSGHLPGTTGAAPGDWTTFNRTLAGDRFSPLTEIDRSNVARLGVVCRYELPEVTALQTGPIVVGGTMFFTTDTISYAIDAATCTERWRSVR